MKQESKFTSIVLAYHSGNLIQAKIEFQQLTKRQKNALYDWLTIACYYDACDNDVIAEQVYHSISIL